MVLVLLLQTLFACCFVIFRESLTVASPYFLVGVRMIFSGIILLGFWGVRRLTLPASNAFVASEQRQKSTIVLYVLGAALFNIFITNAFEMWGLQYVQAAKASFIYNCSPFIAALFSYLVLGERMNRYKWAGLIIGFIGFLPILYTNSAQESGLNHVGFLSTAELAIIAAAIATAFGWISIKKLVYDYGVSIPFANGSSMLLGGILSLLVSCLVESWNPLPITPGAFWYVVGLSLLAATVSCLVAYNLYTLLLKKFSATFMSFAGFLTPLITAFLAWVFLGEVPSLVFFLSFVLVLFGLFVYYRQEI